MKLDRCHFLLLLVVVFLSRRSLAQDDRTPRLPRWLRVFSKGPSPDDDRYEGREIFNHVDNVLRGGTIGVEVDMKKHVGKLNKWWDKVKRYLPAMRRFKKLSSVPEDREVEVFPAEGTGIDPRKRNPFSLSRDRMRAPLDP